MESGDDMDGNDGCRWCEGGDGQRLVVAASGRGRSKLLQLLQQLAAAAGEDTAAEDLCTGWCTDSRGYGCCFSRRRPASAARTLRWDENLPRMGFVTTSSFFLGGMVSQIYDSTGWVRERWCTRVIDKSAFSAAGLRVMEPTIMGALPLKIVEQAFNLSIRPAQRSGSGRHRLRGRPLGRPTA
jgi:hypothetical protein